MTKEDIETQEESKKRGFGYLDYSSDTKKANTTKGGRDMEALKDYEARQEQDEEWFE